VGLSRQAGSVGEINRPSALQLQGLKGMGGRGRRDTQKIKNLVKRECVIGRIQNRKSRNDCSPISKGEEGRMKKEGEKRRKDTVEKVTMPRRTPLSIQVARRVIYSRRGKKGKRSRGDN